MSSLNVTLMNSLDHTQLLQHNELHHSRDKRSTASLRRRHLQPLVKMQHRRNHRAYAVFILHSQRTYDIVLPVIKHPLPRRRKVGRSITGKRRFLRESTSSSCVIHAQGSDCSVLSFRVQRRGISCLQRSSYTTVSTSSSTPLFQYILTLVI